MELSACGPSNALQSLSKHSQQDRSLQQNLVLQGHQQESFAANNLNRTDQRLQTDFAAFQTSANQQFGYAPNAFQQLLYEQQYNQQFPANAAQQQRSEDNQWAQSFQSMSLNQAQQPVARHQPLVRENGMQLHSQQQRAPSAFAANFMRSNMHGGMGTSMPQFAQQLEHHQVHKQEEERALFDREFASVEQELQQAPQAAMAVATPPQDQSLVHAAKQIQSIMGEASATRSAETHSKFQNSSFLKLMQSIATEQVAMSEGQDKFITRDGLDIRDVRALEPQGEPALGHSLLLPPSQVNRLPDPLAFLGEGALAGSMDSPYQASVLAMASMGQAVPQLQWVEDYGFGSGDEILNQWKQNFDGEDMFDLRNQELEAYMGYD